MLYKLLHFPAKLALLIWCRNLRINKKEILGTDGPLLIAANHPNSFLDAILLCALFKNPIYSLARGDAFKSNFIRKILSSLNMFPVYRVSEGVENLEENYKTFDDCIKVFKKNGIVLIFSEGRCINEWNLRPLKKGTARLAISAWEQGIPLKVIPLGLNYHSFTSFGKNVIANFGEFITQQNIVIKNEDAYGIKVQAFNAALKIQLEQLVIQIKPADEKILKQTFKNRVSSFKKILLFIPALLGFLLHAPLYIPIQKFAFKKFGKIDHYDSVMVGMLFLLYPFYLLFIALLIYWLLGGGWWFLVCIILPFLAWSYVGLKKQT
ncbi:MAG: 1-acyl-sn-glycerol-3-phosphate acyltransferase [Ferruginibacter sp.]|nr:1-acyl-sn-glycerol-3-phosphate acyltransferase [Ferruginibacter sp.]